MKSSESSSSMAIEVDFSAGGARRMIGMGDDDSITRMLFTDPNAFDMLCLSGSYAHASSTRYLYSNLPTGMLISHENDPASALSNVG